MGLLVQTSFDTPEGIPVSSVYFKLTGLMVDFLSSTKVQVLVKYEAFISREKRIVGARSLKVPSLPEYIVITVSPSDAWGTHAYLYAALKTHLEEAGLTVEDVLEPPSVVVAEETPAPVVVAPVAEWWLGKAPVVVAEATPAVE